MDTWNLLRKAGLDEESRQKRLDFLAIGPDDEKNLVLIRSCAEENLDRIVDKFYVHLMSFEDTRTLLADEKLVEGLKEMQRQYFLRMVAGNFDAQYFESRLRVGDAHQRIELQPEWYVGIYNLYLRLIIECLQEDYADDQPKLLALIGTISKVIFLDMALAIDAYIMGGFVHRSLAQEYRRVAEVAERTLHEKEEVERMKAELTNMIVHDLKGPLGGILTTTQLALRKRGAVAAAHERHFEQIQRSARDLLRMISNLLEIDRMQEGRLELRVESVDIGQLMLECADEFRSTAEIAGQSIQVKGSDDVPVIATDRWLLRRVLNNLLVNAIRHSGTQGTICLEAENGRSAVQIRVRDTGRGIPAADQAMLFTKNRSRGHRLQSREDTGLGLVFCKMAVDTLGGSIDVQSDLGAGATFTVTLPTANSVESTW